MSCVLDRHLIPPSRMCGNPSSLQQQAPSNVHNATNLHPLLTYLRKLTVGSCKVVHRSVAVYKLFSCMTCQTDRYFPNCVNCVQVRRDLWFIGAKRIFAASNAISEALCVIILYWRICGKASKDFEKTKQPNTQGSLSELKEKRRRRDEEEEQTEFPSRVSEQKEKEND